MAATLGGGLIANAAPHPLAAAAGASLSYAGEPRTGDAARSLSVADNPNLRPFVAPTASFTRSPEGFLKPGDVVTFDASTSSGDSDLKYEWWIDYDTNNPGEQEVDPELVGTDKVLEYTVPRIGNYTVELVVIDSNGVQGYDIDWIWVLGPGPAVSSTQSPPESTLPPGKVTFDATASTGEEVRYDWYVNNATRPSSTDPVFTYAFKKPGNYNIKLVVTDVWGRPVSESRDLTITAPADPPVARFTQSPSSPTVEPGTKVTFDAGASTGDQLTYAWYVRGESGIVSPDKVLAYTFKNPGKYGVQLVVSDSAELISTSWIEVTVKPATTEPTVAKLAQTPSTATVATGTKVRFDGSASTGDGLKYAWYVRGEKGVVSTGKVLNYTFKKAGDYGVELRVTNSTGVVAKKWVGLTVTGTNTPPTAKFTQAPSASTVKVGTAVTFDGSTSSDPDGDQLKYFWFVRGEKGAVGTGKSLAYTFKKAGSYGVELRVVDPSGSVAKKWVGLTVTG